MPSRLYLARLDVQPVALVTMLVGSVELIVIITPVIDVIILKHGDKSCNDMGYVATVMVGILYCKCILAMCN